MEIEVSGNSNILLKPGSKTKFGRGSGIVTDDRTVSRHHVAFELPLTTSDVPKVRFEVIGRNPIWVHGSRNGKVNSFTSTQSGEMEAGDRFCISAKTPIWFTLRKAEFGGQIEDKCERKQDLEENLVGICELIDDEDLELESVDISCIDPVKEFGFLVLGHEFDRYPKKMIGDMKDWDWFIEEAVMESEDDEYQKRKKSRRGKRKKGDENDDDEWTAESDEETKQIASVHKVPKPKYTTRSKDHGKRSKAAGKDLHLKQKSRATDQKFEDDEEEDDTDEDEDDQTLGGFIIDDELEQDEEIDDNEDEEEEEEEEFEEEDDEDE